jgi:hypothetical protein
MIVMSAAHAVFAGITIRADVPFRKRFTGVELAVVELRAVRRERCASPVAPNIPEASANWP